MQGLMRLLSVVLVLLLVACTTQTDTITVEQVWIRAAATGTTSAAYMQVHNNGRSAVSLVRIESDAAEALEIHQTVVENEIARMEHLEQGLVIPAGESVSLSPNGIHVMLINVPAPLVEGEKASLRLVFDNGTIIVIDAPIQLDAEGSAGHSSHGD